jgi:hypothetical protein
VPMWGRSSVMDGRPHFISAALARVWGVVRGQRSLRMPEAESLPVLL